MINRRLRFRRDSRQNRSIRNIVNAGPAYIVLSVFMLPWKAKKVTVYISSEHRVTEFWLTEQSVFFERLSFLVEK